MRHPPLARLWSMHDRTQRIARLSFLAILAIYGVLCLRTPDAGRLLDGVDLAIHETGHLVFAPFGQTIMVLGGTLLQLIFPALFVAYFVRNRDGFAAAVCLWWVAQNCWHISVYVADARAQELPLVGGGEHDWAYLLYNAGWMMQDQALARAIHSVGVAIFLAALWIGWRSTADPPRGSPAAPG